MVKELETNNFNELIKEGYTFVDFYADWCNPCMMMSPIVDEVSEEISDIKFMKVNCDVYGDLCMQYRVSSIPRFLIFKDGELKNMKVGAMSKEDLLCFIKENIK